MSPGVSYLEKQAGCTGEIEEHDPHTAACFVQMTVASLKQEYYDGVLNFNLDFECHEES